MNLFYGHLRHLAHFLLKLLVLIAGRIKMNQEQEIERIKQDIVDHYKDKCKFILIFGSMADQKRFNQGSDIDFALYLKDEFRDLDYYDFTREFELEQSRDVDTIILNKADIIITMQSLTNGELLFCEDEKFFINYKAQKESEYIEFKEWRRPLEDKLIEN